MGTSIYLFHASIASLIPTCRDRNLHKVVSKGQPHDYQSPFISHQKKVMPPREIDVRISQGCGVHIDVGWKMDPRVKPEDD